MIRSLTVIVLAYNEEKNINESVTGVLNSLKGRINDFEVLVINDGSTDATGKIVGDIAKKYKKVRLISQKKNMGFGTSFKNGIARASKEYVIGFPGDNDTSAKIIEALAREADKFDLVISYNANLEDRSYLRKFFSKTFTLIMDKIFGTKLKYYNGSFICKTQKLRSIRLVSRGFAIYAEAKVRLIKMNLKYREIPFEYTGRKFGKSKAVSFKSVVETLATIRSLAEDIYLKREYALHLNKRS